MKEFLMYPLYPSSLSLMEKLVLKLKTIICPVCGKVSKIDIKGTNWRETCKCLNCGASNRQRQIAYSVCKIIGSIVNEKNKNISTLKTALIIYHTESQGPLHNFLSKIKTYVSSEYFGESHKSGTIINGVMNQNLSDLSFDNDSIDIVLSTSFTSIIWVGFLIKNTFQGQNSSIISARQYKIIILYSIKVYLFNFLPSYPFQVLGLGFTLAIST